LSQKELGDTGTRAPLVDDAMSLARARRDATKTVARACRVASSRVASTSTSSEDAMRLGSNGNAARVRAMDEASAARFRTFAINMARKRIGMMTTYDSATEEALRRALRDAFGADGGVRVGRRARRRFDALREAMRRSSGGRAVIGDETNVRGILESGDGARGRLEAGETRDVIVASAWDDDIEWGARLSKRKLRRVESSLAMNSASKDGDVAKPIEAPRYDELDAAVYAVMRSPMTMGALKRIFYETRDRLGDEFRPKSVLDFGSGPVPTTLFAVRAVFGEHVGAYGAKEARRDGDINVAFVDSNPGMMRFARRVAGYAKNIEEERRAAEALERLSLESATSEEGEEEDDEETDEDAFERFVKEVEVDENGDEMLKLDFSDFEARDEKPSTRPASALRLKTPHPWHESEGIRTSASLRGANRRGGFDVVVSSYALGEIPDAHVTNARGRVVRHQRQRDVVIRQLWDKVAPGGILVIAEPGTPKGSLLVRRARAMILEVARRDMEQNARRLEIEPKDDDIDAYIVAPCQHDKPCPLKDSHSEDGFSTWCHFPQRTARSAYVREMKHGSRPYQDEKFSYVVVRKMPRAVARDRAHRAAQSAHDRRDSGEYDADADEDELHDAIARDSADDWSRVIRQPMKRKGHVVFELCTPEGEIERATVAKSHGRPELIGRDGYKYARKLRWGDLWPFANRTVIKPGDQRAFELEAARFEFEYFRELASRLPDGVDPGVVDRLLFPAAARAETETDIDDDVDEIDILADDDVDDDDDLDFDLLHRLTADDDHAPPPGGRRA